MSNAMDHFMNMLDAIGRGVAAQPAQQPPKRKTKLKKSKAAAGSAGAALNGPPAQRADPSCCIKKR